MTAGAVGKQVGIEPQPVDRFWRSIAVIAAAALGIRMAALFLLPRLGHIDGLGGDGGRYHLAAKALADGHGFTNPFLEGHVPDALHPPLWTAVLAIAHLAGARTPMQQVALALLIGVGTVVLLGIAGREILSPRAGLIAAALGAAYPGLWVYERNLNAETLVFPLVTGIIIVTYRYRGHPTLGRALTLAGLIALLTLARSEQILLVPLLLIPLVWTTPGLDRPHRLGRLALAGCTLLLLLSPWTVYNLDRFERPVILSAGAGNAMIVASCDEAFGGNLMGSYDVACYFRAAEQVDEIDRTLQDVEFRRISLDYTMDHLDRLPVVVVAREGRSWSFFRPAQQTLMHGEQLGIEPAVISAQILMYWVLVVAAVAGAIELRRRSTAIYPLMAFPIIVTVSAAMAFGDIRYRAPAEIPIILLAAVMVDVHLRRRRSSASVGKAATRAADGTGDPEGSRTSR